MFSSQMDEFLKEAQVDRLIRSTLSESDKWWIQANVAAVLCAFFTAQPQTEAQRLQLVRTVECPTELIEHGDRLCGFCGHQIDSQVCHCGVSLKHHRGENHSFVPMGCTCGYYDAEKRTVLALVGG